MKQLLFSFITLGLCFTSVASFAQEKLEQYCELRVTKKQFSSKYSAEIIFGTNSLIISSDQPKIKQDVEFIPDALNYLGQLGWTLVSSEKPTQYTSQWNFIFKKTFIKEEQKPSSGDSGKP